MFSVCYLNLDLQTHKTVILCWSWKIRLLSWDMLAKWFYSSQILRPFLWLIFGCLMKKHFQRYKATQFCKNLNNRLTTKVRLLSTRKQCLLFQYLLLYNSLIFLKSLILVFTVYLIVVLFAPFNPIINISSDQN